jgi:hypothetical protein
VKEGVDGVDELKKDSSRMPKVGDSDVLELLDPPTQAAWVDVGVVSDLHLLVTGGKRFGGVPATCTAGDVGRTGVVHLLLRRVAYDGDNVRDTNGEALVEEVLAIQGVQAAALAYSGG